MSDAAEIVKPDETAAAAAAPHDQMTESEFFDELKNSLVILTTSSPDKRVIYEEMFAALGKSKHHAGVNFYHTDSGRLGIAPRKTEERTNEYSGNLEEKWRLQLAKLREQQENIRLKLPGNEFNHKKIPLMGMTEDSGIQLVFADPDSQARFLDKIREKLKRVLAPGEYGMLDKLDATGFPGPNLKPLQEHMEGGFHDLMTLIYDTADETGIHDLRFSQTVKVSFVSTRLNKHFPMSFECHGRLLTRKEYAGKLLGTSKGDAININFVQVFDGQKNDTQKTLDELIHDGLHHKSSEDLPCDYARRAMVEYLQGNIGKRKSSHDERKRPVKVAFVNPDSMNDKDAPVEVRMSKVIRDLQFTGVPTLQQLRHFPSLKPFGEADVIVLVPDNSTHTDKRLRSNRNYNMILKYTVSGVTDPEAMTVPLILDNRSGAFDAVLPLIGDAYMNGRSRGDKTFYVVNSDIELNDALERAKDIKQRAPVITRIPVGEDLSTAAPPIEKVRGDGTFTVFIGGGHDNNSERDKREARELGKYCAQHGWRIITGGGTIDGSMGSVHTGFIQYHLDQLKDRTDSAAVAFKTRLEEYVEPDASGSYDAAQIIKNAPELIDEIANKGFIPRNMFYAYSMEPLLEMESHSGKPPPGVTYFEAGNRVRRLDGLLASGTKIFTPGSIGTDEEFEDTIKQHLDARERKLAGEPHSNDNTMFADGTPDTMGKMIIYNRNHHLDRLLADYGLDGEDTLSQLRRDEYNVVIVNSLDKLQEHTLQTAINWEKRVRGESQTAGLVASRTKGG